MSDMHNDNVVELDEKKLRRMLNRIYQLERLNSKTGNFTIEDYMNRAFRDDAEEANAEKLKQNMATFNSYVCGGFEYLQEKFGQLDKTEDVVDAVYEMVHDFAVDMELLEDGDLPDFVPTFD